MLYLFTFTENGKLYAQIHIGLTEKTIVIGEALGDDLWHSVKLERRGMVLSLGLDDDRPIIGKLFLRLQEFMLSLVQVNLCQKHLFYDELTQSMTKDCPLIYQFSTWKLQT